MSISIKYHSINYTRELCFDLRMDIIKSCFSIKPDNIKKCEKLIDTYKKFCIYK